MSHSWWWHIPLIPALGRESQVDLCEFEASLVYRVSSRTARATQRNPVLKNKTKQKKERKQRKKQSKRSTPKLLLQSQHLSSTQTRQIQQEKKTTANISDKHRLKIFNKIFANIYRPLPKR
jgi:capsid protein